MEIYLRFPEGRSKVLTFSFDDGAYQDIKLVEIFNRYGMKATFNLNSGLMADDDSQGNINGRLTVNQAKELFTNSVHEVACHGYTHPRMDSATPFLSLRETLKDREKLEEMLGVTVRGMAYPYGGHTDETVEMLRKAGIVYSRNVNMTANFNIPLDHEKDWLRLEPTCHYAQLDIMKLADDFLAINDRWHPVMFYIWGHSSDFDLGNNWHIIYDFCEKMSGKDEVWYATNIEIYDYFDAYYHLQFSAAFTRVYNPSAISVWFKLDKEVYEVKPGETIELPKR